MKTIIQEKMFKKSIRKCLRNFSNLYFENIKEAEIKNGKIVRLIYKHGSKLEFFTNQEITYVLFDDVEFCYIEDNKINYNK